MTENTPPSAPAGNVPEYSVSELSGALKRTVETAFARIRVRGEISGWKKVGSGHCYFAVKDAEAVLEAVCWRGSVARLSIAPEDGMEVICTGRLTTYPGRSKYQMVVEAIELAGQGALLKLLEDRKRRLEAEGLFDPARKRKIPFLPEVIGVVTSPTGAVIRDILHRLRDRFPRHVLVWPVLVQGEGAAQQIAAAIDGFNRIPADSRSPKRPDVLIVARGGGSLEDLLAFNEEIVVRAAAASTIPLISAVGHETDVTLIDFAADLRAPTPTAAAEMAVPVRADLLAQVMKDGARLLGGMERALDNRRTHLAGLARGLPDPRRLLESATQRLDDRMERLANALPNLLERRHREVERLAARLRSPREQVAAQTHRLDMLAARLDGAVKDILARSEGEYERLAPARILPAAAKRLLAEGARRLETVAKLLESFSYQRVLERGFVLVRDAAGEPVTKATSTRPGMAVSLHFADGKTGATIDGAAPILPAPAPRKPRKQSGPSGQGSLL